MLTQTATESGFRRATHPGRDGKARAVVPRAVGTPDMTDEQLIERIADGDEGAMHTLYARQSLRIYRFILRLTDNAATAEDLLSDVFIDVWRSAARFKHEARVSTWLLAI